MRHVDSENLGKTLLKTGRDRRIKMDSTIVLNVGNRHFNRPGLFVCAARNERIKDIRHSNDSPGFGDGVSGKTIWIATAVPLLVMAHGDHAGQLQEIIRVVSQNIGPECGVGLHDLPFIRIQFSRLAKNGIGDAYFPDVVHRAGMEHQFTVHHAPSMVAGQSG